MSARTKTGRRSARRSERGVILLVVLSLLVLFMVITVTFVVVTAHYKRTSQSYARIGRTSSQNAVGRLADEVVYQLIRGTRGSSAFRNQSLLDDLYGNDGFLGFVRNTTLDPLPSPPFPPGQSGPFMQITAYIDPLNLNYSQIDTLIRTGVVTDGCFNGRVLTLMDSVWMPGLDGRWGQAGGPTANDDNYGPTNDLREAGWPGSDDERVTGRMWTMGNDLRWGIASTDDDGDGITDNFSEAGAPGSDDVLIPFTDPGPDRAWGTSGVNDNGDAWTDNYAEANWPGSDDRKVSPVASTRVVASTWVRDASDPSIIVALNLTVESFASLPMHVQGIPTVGQRFVINGAPFNGTGLGYHQTTQGLDLNVPISQGADGQWGVALTDDDNDGTTDELDEAGAFGSDDVAFPVALIQNFNAYRSSTFAGTPLSSLATADFAWSQSGVLNATAGGMDESYDIPDYQNMYLAATVPSATGSADIVPSFHRPELVNYLFHWAVSNLFWDSTGGSWWVDPPVHWAMFMTPFGLDGKPGTGDDPPNNPGFPGMHRLLCNDIKRWCIFRPLPSEHPNFGSPTQQNQWRGSDSSNSRMITGPFDVDNDGDGINDSIWIDAGLPPVRLADGRLAKPMVAIQVEDLDNRLDLNAHGGLENNVVQRHATFNFHPGRDGRWGWAGVDDNGDGTIDDIGERGMVHPTSSQPSDDIQIAGRNLQAGAGLPAGPGIGRGFGMGPAEIALRPLFEEPYPSAPFSATYTSGLLSIINDRYRRAGSATILPGSVDGMDDELSLIKDFHFPINYWNTSFAQTSFATPPDIRGLGAVALDFNGQPIHAFQGASNDVVDDPYELAIGGESYVGRTTGDRIYTVYDLERILRWADQDSRQLSSRLSDLAPDVFQHISARRLVTTLSSHIATPNVAIPQDQRSQPYSPSPPAIGNYWKNRTVLLGATALPTPTTAPTVYDLFCARFAQGGLPLGSWTYQLDLMVPFEMRKGLPFDVNRPFGNGRDDDGDGIVDEPSEPIDLAALSTFEPAWIDPGQTNYDLPPGSQYIGRRFNASNQLSINGSYVDPLSDPARYQGFPNARQVYARHLYCLMMAMMDPAFLGSTVETLTPPLQQALLAQRVAQWAVNVVDARDPDGIMTPFEYDIFPFNGDGWSVDGVPGARRTAGADNLWGTADDGWVNDAGSPDRALVWGCEAPDLLISESVAFHDRCVKDTDQDNGTAMNKFRGPAMTDDDDLDQYRKPIGSLFVELYATRTPNRVGSGFGNRGTMPLELYNAAGNLDVTRVAPARPAGVSLPGIAHPVWRLAISEELAPADPARNAYTATPPTPDTTTFSPAFDDIERMIWFAALAPTGGYPEADKVFYGRSGSVVLPPNRYLVVGPRAVTPIGSKDDDGDLTNNYSDYSLHYNSTHVIDLSGGTVTAKDNSDPPGTAYTYPTVGTDIQTPFSMVCAADAPVGWSEPGYQVGINVSEPLPTETYYPKPFDLATGSYFDPGSTTSLPDQPFDEDSGSFPDSPLANPSVDVATGTRVNYRGIYLQRLADPTQPWNPEPTDPDLGSNYDPSMPVNPYLTVDFSSVDLTVFSGDEDTGRMVGGEWLDEDHDPDPFSGAAPQERLRGRERGADFAVGSNPRNIWSAYTATPAVTGIAATADPEMYFRVQLEHTLGYLNSTFGTPSQQGSQIGMSLVMPEATGSPFEPFPWLALMDRPYANPYELLMVPSSSPSRLTYEFTGAALTAASGTAALHPMIPDTSETPYAGATPDNYRAPYANMLNFFHSSVTGGPLGANFSRLLDLLETPSPFVNAQRSYNPAHAELSPMMDNFRPPHNRLSRFRDPGRININTIYDVRVWNAINEGFANFKGDSGASTPADRWDAMLESRQGYAGTFNASYPSRFNNPFRAAAASDLMPNTGYSRRDLSTGAVVQGPMSIRKPSAEATLLRTDPDVAGPDFVPLFDNVSDISRPERNAAKNPFFRYQGLARLSNLVSNHSNVFSVRITIGYFELEPWLDPATGAVIRDDAHPDGMAIGHEVSGERGDMKRERAFFIIDRSIPVGFEPDENHNIDKAILIRRYIN